MKRDNIIDKAAQQRFIWTKQEKPTTVDILSFVDNYMQSAELRKLRTYAQYFESLNPEMLKRYTDKLQRNKTPNHFVPTGYYGTIVETMAGYLYQNVQYVSDDKQFSESLKEILDYNEIDVIDMETGIRALTYNKAAEIVYTVGDENNTQIEVVGIDPRQMIFVYNSDIKPQMICGIYIIKSPSPDFDYYVDVIYSDEWQYYTIKDNVIAEREPSRPLYFSQCPVIEYRTESLNNNSSFNKVIPYIDALDFIMSGNSNEVSRLVDALLVIGKIIKDEDLEHMEEWKVLQGMKTEDRAEYLTKDMSPQFREYVSKLLIQEIHKHSHVIDWYSPDSGMSGDVSGKALITRLFDMDMFSKRIEKVYKRGAYKRIDLISELMSKKSMPVSEDYKIVFNRTLPNMTVDTAVAIKDVAFLSNKTKMELSGIDYETEKERLEDEKEETIEISQLLSQSDRTKPVDNTEKEVKSADELD